jgi:predicted DNA-binding transcriptional regulator YafY
MSKYDRLLLILNLLRARRNLRVSDLANECEVSERTIYRDIISLSSANIPIYFENGYKMLTDAFLPPLNLNLEEYLCLKLALSSSLIKHRPWKNTSKAVLAKIDASLSKGLKEQVGAIDIQPKIDSKTTFDFSKSTLIFKLLEQAISEKVSSRISYDSLESGKSEREVDPYALVFRRHAWYLIGFCHKRKEVRIFRINRIEKITLLSRNFVWPIDFSVEKFFASSWEVYQGAPTEAKIKFWGKAAKVILSGTHHPDEKITKQRDGSILYSLTVNGIEEISRWVLEFGENAVVLEPEELKEKITQTSRGILKNYQTDEFRK